MAQSAARAKRRAEKVAWDKIPEMRFNVYVGGMRMWLLLGMFRLLPAHNTVRVYTRWWYAHKLLRLFSAKRVAYRVFAAGHLLSADYRLERSGKLTLVRMNTLTSPTIGILVKTAKDALPPAPAFAPAPAN